MEPKRYRGYQKVFKIDNYDTKKSSLLYKYMNVERAFEFLTSRTYYFVEPTKWNDPYEKRFYTADYTNVNYHPCKLFCTCVTENGASEAAWNAYVKHASGIASRTVRFAFNRKKFLTLLEQKIGNASLFIGKANYSYTTAEINNMHLKNPISTTSCSLTKYCDFFNEPCCDETFLRLMLIKRKHFSYEKETRLFIVENKKNENGFKLDSNSKDVKVIKFTKSELMELISSVSIDPSCTDAEAAIITKVLKSKLKGQKCEKNPLYRCCDSITIDKP